MNDVLALKSVNDVLDISIMVTITYGKTKLYTLNTESEVVKDLIKLKFELIKQSMENSAHTEPVLVTV